ncbi:MAG: CBS domain-containing protein [Deltaproteobacteria bacterium]|nr:CBS domain-containing protein [Deltaproteobacteria bacterium]
MKKNKAADIMSKHLTTIAFDAGLAEALALMTAKRIRHLPVIDTTGATVGILSDRDLRRAMKPDSQNAQFDPAHRVKDFMTWPACSVSTQTPLFEVAEQMLRDRFSAYLVVAHDRRHPCGIITTDDMIKLLLVLLVNDPTRGRLSLGEFMDNPAYEKPLWS